MFPCSKCCSLQCRLQAPPGMPCVLAARDNINTRPIITNVPKTISADNPKLPRVHLSMALRRAIVREKRRRDNLISLEFNILTRAFNIYEQYMK